MENIKQIFKELATYLGKKLDELSSQNDSIVSRLEEIVRKDSPIIQVYTPKGDPGHTPTDEELLDLIKPLIPNAATTDELTSLIKPLIPVVRDGETPSDERLLKLITPLVQPPPDFQLRRLIKPLIPKPVKGDSGSPDTGEEIIVKINNDKSDRLIRKEKVEGLANIENMARTADANSRSFMNTGSYVYAQDISDQLNGILKTFTLVSNAKVILAFGSSTPGVFRPTTDYTTTGSTITFTSEITAASTLATGQTVIILYKLV